ncbi:MAG: tRNA (N(6)-L-threonylcarbamoyladenosine(37)-C(2))-methylthiotransferase MtaB [Candidatus Omnitrophota bacterium]
MKVKFFTLGCKVNQYETQALAEKFIKYDCVITSGKADLYVINTCTVTQQADAKSKQAVVKARKENPQAKIAVAGCLAEFNSDSILPYNVDYIIPQSKKHLLPDIVMGEKPSDKNVWSLKISRFFNHRAFIKVQDGCNNMCAFCKIPHIRGKPTSRNKHDVTEEVKALIADYQEIVLCGTNLGLYGQGFLPPYDLFSLVSELLSIDGLGRIRLSSIEPYSIDDRLISLYKDKKLCPHLHLPFQSGDDNVLKMMNKKETTQMYYDIAEKIRTVRPAAALSCDIIVGFPGETEECFNNTLKFLRAIRPMRMHVFRFSPRDKTFFDGMRLREQEDIKRRVDTLKELNRELSLSYKKNFINKNLWMVAEEHKGEYTVGYTENYLRVNFKGRIGLGKILGVVPYDVNDNGEVFVKVHAP